MPLLWSQNEDRVLDTQVMQKDGEVICRRRECLQCKSRFSTIENLSLVYPYVIKKTAVENPFSRENIKGLRLLAKNALSVWPQIESIVDRIGIGSSIAEKRNSIQTNWP